MRVSSAGLMPDPTHTALLPSQSDITQLVNSKKSELAARHAAMQAAAATEAKSQFLARMSHEIRTPLNGMIAVGQLLAETSLSPSQWDLVNTIRCSGETLLTLISDILDFSRIEVSLGGQGQGVRGAAPSRALRWGQGQGSRVLACSVPGHSCRFSLGLQRLAQHVGASGLAVVA